MTPTLLIARRELGAYLPSWSGYVIIALFLVIVGVLFNAFALGGPDKRSADVVGQFFFICSPIAVAASILISMRLIAEERQSGTIDLLYSSPISDAQIIMGKYLSALAFLALLLACTVYMPLLILVNGKLSWGHVGAGYLGLLLIGSASIAISTFGSALARSQVIAVVVSTVMVVALACCWFLAKVTERPLNDIFSSLALHGQHFQPFQSGIVHLRDVVYYVLVSYVALFGATRVLEARRWR